MPDGETRTYVLSFHVEAEAENMEAAGVIHDVVLAELTSRGLMTVESGVMWTTPDDDDE